jgi:spermidine synthase
MRPWEILERERAPEGGELVLYRRNDDFVIRVDGRELMSSRASHSEEELARLVIARLIPRDDLRVLVGGLGMGFTTRATLDALPPGGQVIVAEIVPAVIRWNRGALAGLAGHPLDDPRAEVFQGDVAEAIATAKTRFDAILLDVDNGPEGLTRKANQMLYTERGLSAAKRTLRPGGVLAVWSAGPDAAFERRLRKVGFETQTATMRSRGAAGGRMHTIFLARIPRLAPLGSPG